MPQSIEAQTELRLLSASKYKIISAQSSKPNMCIVQDSLLGAFKMTLGIQQIEKQRKRRNRTHFLKERRDVRVTIESGMMYVLL